VAQGVGFAHRDNRKGLLGHSGRQTLMDHMIHILLDTDAQLGSHSKQAQ
jgi:hypothetical protein